MRLLIPIAWPAHGKFIVTVSVACFASGCLINTELYEEQRALLADSDGDGISIKSGDCDDTDPEVYPGAVEHCDERDEDCNGEVDEAAVDMTQYFLDADGDGAGAGEPKEYCASVEGFVDNDEDCDDTDASVGPDADEVPYDGVDQDCSGSDLVDVDGDGFDGTKVGGVDCDDTNASVNPGAEEIPYDGVDQDCSGADSTDVDEDGVDSVDAGGTDCDDLNASVHPGADEGWSDGLTDNDCDGTLELQRLEFGSEVIHGEGAQDHAGERVTDLGDMDGDGLVEYLVGAPYSNQAHELGGGVYVVGGSASEDLGSFPRLDPAGADDHLGLALDGGPDVTGDGYSDILSGSPFLNEAYLVSGESVWSQARSDIDDEMLLAVVSDGGASAACTTFLGDITGDGVEDAAICEPLGDAGGNDQAGRLAIVSMDRRGVLDFDDADVVWHGPGEGNWFGNWAESVGDQDGDGYDDVLVAAGWNYVFAVLPGGDTSGGDIVDTSMTVMYADDGGANQVPRTDAVGDINGDGRQDVVLMDDDARFFVDLDASAILHLSSDSPYATLRSEGDGSGTTFYDAVSLGDHDGDGQDETLLTIPQDSEEGGTGFFAVVRGSELTFGVDEDVHALLLTATSTRVDSFFGQRGAYLGDTDGDGQDDLAVGGYSDSEGGANAGGVVVLPVPR